MRTKEQDRPLNYLVEWSSYSLMTRKDAFNVSHSYFQAAQEVSSIPMWNPIASIVFSTGLLPILATNTSPPTSYSIHSKSNFTSSGNNSNLTDIITNFGIPISETDPYRPVICCSPSSEYRLVDMHSIINMNMLDITVFWKTHYGVCTPLKLQPGCAAHIKLLFRNTKFNFVNDL